MNGTTPEVIEAMCYTAIANPDESMDSIEDAVLDEMSYQLQEGIKELDLPTPKSIPRMRLQMGRLPEALKDKYERQIEHENNLNLFRFLKIVFKSSDLSDHPTQKIEMDKNSHIEKQDLKYINDFSFLPQEITTENNYSSDTSKVLINSAFLINRIMSNINERQITREFTRFRMYPGGDDAFFEFIPGQSKISMPRFSFDKKRRSVLETFSDPCPEETEEE
jgi:hypothetical protein